MKIPEYTRSVYRILKITTFYNNQYIYTTDEKNALNYRK